MDQETINESNSESNNSSKSGNSRMLLFVGIAFIGLAVFTLFSFILPGVEKSKKESNLNLCYNNVKRLSVQLDVYKKQQGKYPQSLESLVPGYFEGLPACPEAGKDTYSEGYIVSSDGSTFTLFCRGNHHSDLGIPPNFPFYSSKEGLVRKR